MRTGVGVEGMERETEEARDREREGAREKDVVREWLGGGGGGGGARDQPNRAVRRDERDGSFGGCGDRVECGCEVVGSPWM